MVKALKLKMSSSTRNRRCSHCKETGHNIRTCPNMNSEERQRRNDERLARNIRRQQLISQNTNIPGYKKQKVRIENNNNYPVCVFWNFNDETEHANRWIMFSIVIPELGGVTTLTFSRHHDLKVVPLDEINSDNPTNIVSLFEVDYISGTNFFDTTSQIDIYEHDVKYCYTIQTKEYTRILDPVTMWKTVGLKSMFLLKNLIRLGADKNDTYGVILDLVQDITVPEHTEMDKELAGIPSEFTNIT